MLLYYHQYNFSILISSSFRDECENVRQTLLAQQREENNAAMNHMLTLKEKELDAYKKELQEQIARYQQQVSHNGS